MKWKVEVERQRESREKMSVGLWHEDPPALRVPGGLLNREFFVNSGVQKAWPIYNCLGFFVCVFFFHEIPCYIYFSLITCIIVTKRKNLCLSLYSQHSWHQMCASTPINFPSLSSVSPQLDILQFNYDTNYLQLAQARQLRNQSHKAAPSFRHQLTSSGSQVLTWLQTGVPRPFPWVQ